MLKTEKKKDKKSFVSMIISFPPFPPSSFFFDTLHLSPVFPDHFSMTCADEKGEGEKETGATKQATFWYSFYSKSVALAKVSRPTNSCKDARKIWYTNDDIRDIEGAKSMP